MRSCLVLIFIIIGVGYLLKTSLSDNPMRSLLENTGTVPPVRLAFETRPWFLSLGHSGYLKFINKSGNSAVITGGRIVRPDGKVKKLDGLPSLVKPNDVAEMKLMDGMVDFQTVPGDRIEIFFEGFEIPRVLEFQEGSK